MERYKEEFIEFMVDSQVLRFGEFITKSGRKSPFFINTGFYNTGEQLLRLGRYYAQAIANEFGTDFDIVFGPAYKGIPLATTVSMALFSEYGATVRYCSNRKEVKDHGDVGILLGSPIQNGDRVMMVEDVTTSGKSIAETMPIIKNAAPECKLCGLMVSVNRQERGTGTKSSFDEIEETYGMKVRAIVTMDEVIEHLYNKPYKGKVYIDDAMKRAIDEYYAQYGAK